jgi:hypothetical protein
MIEGDRNNAYGPPTQDFARTAALWSAWKGVPFQAHEVAVFLILLKQSRLAWQPEKRDNWTDTAGYAGCGYECVVPEEHEMTLQDVSDIEENNSQEWWKEHLTKLLYGQ